MRTVPEVLGNQRHALLQQWLNSPARRAQQVLAVTAAAWWPDGEVPTTRKAAQRHAGRHHALRRQRAC